MVGGYLYFGVLQLVDVFMGLGRKFIFFQYFRLCVGLSIGVLVIRVQEFLINDIRSLVVQD